MQSLTMSYPVSERLGRELPQKGLNSSLTWRKCVRRVYTCIADTQRIASIHFYRKCAFSFQKRLSPGNDYYCFVSLTKVVPISAM